MGPAIGYAEAHASEHDLRDLQAGSAETHAVVDVENPNPPRVVSVISMLARCRACAPDEKTQGELSSFASRSRDRGVVWSWGTLARTDSCALWPWCPCSHSHPDSSQPADPRRSRRLRRWSRPRDRRWSRRLPPRRAAALRRRAHLMIRIGPPRPPCRAEVVAAISRRPDNRPRP